MRLMLFICAKANLSNANAYKQARLRVAFEKLAKRVSSGYLRDLSDILMLTEGAIDMTIKKRYFWIAAFIIIAAVAIVFCVGRFNQGQATEFDGTLVMKGEVMI